MISFWRHILILVLFANCVSEYSHFYVRKFCKNRSIIKINKGRLEGTVGYGGPQGPCALSFNVASAP